MKAGNLKIGQILINSGDITEEQLEEVLEKQRNSDTKKRIADILIEDKIVTEQQVCRALEKQLFMPYVDLDTIAIPDELSGLIPEEMAQKNMVVPIEQDGRFLTVAIGDPLNYKGLKDLSITTKMKIMPVIAERLSTMQRNSLNQRAANQRRSRRRKRLPNRMPMPMTSRLSVLLIR